MNVGIRSLGLTYISYKLYDVTFFDDIITTLVTARASIVDNWISDMEQLHGHRLNRLIVGLDIEWNPYSDAGTTNPPATLQLCIGRNCLIFQILHASEIPQALFDFLSNGNYTFVGVGIGRDIDKLCTEYGLEVARSYDLAVLAAERLNDWSLRNAGLVMLAREVLGKGFEKPRWVTMSGWDDYCLSMDQIQYACLDAFVSFEIGRSLRASN